MANCLDDIIDALGCLPAEEDEFEELLDGLAILEGPEKFKRRGHLLTQHMRLHKKLKTEQRAPTIAEHVQLNIDNYHNDYCVRKTEKIDVSQKKPDTKVNDHKKWIGAAVLRACWGLRPRSKVVKKVRASIRKRKKRPDPAPPPAPTTMSNRAFASFYRANHTHVQSVRDSTAQFINELQKEAAARKLGSRMWDEVFMTLALDETDYRVTLDEARGTTASTMTIHAHFCCYYGEVKEDFEIVMPPILLESTRGATLLAALLRRLPIDLDWVKTCVQPGKFIIFLSSDSGPGCLKLARIMKMYPGICRMHQIALVMSGSMGCNGLQGALFSSAILFRRRRVQDMLRRQFKTYLEK